MMLVGKGPPRPDEAGGDKDRADLAACAQSRATTQSREAD